MSGQVDLFDAGRADAPGQTLLPDLDAGSAKGDHEHADRKASGIECGPLCGTCAGETCDDCDGTRETVGELTLCPSTWAGGLLCEECYAERLESARAQDADDLERGVTP